VYSRFDEFHGADIVTDDAGTPLALALRTLENGS
jgi:hypothetical protein